MAFHGQGSDPNEMLPNADINVTPFIDVMLVLLIIFMVTAPLLSQGMKVELPKAASALPLDNKTVVTITIATDGRLQVADAFVADAELIGAVRAKLETPQSPIRIRADKATRYEDFVKVIDKLTGEGLTRLVFVLDPASGADRAPGQGP